MWLDWARHPYGPLFFQTPVPLAYCQSLPAGSLALPSHVPVRPPLERPWVISYSDLPFLQRPSGRFQSHFAISLLKTSLKRMDGSVLEDRQFVPIGLGALILTAVSVRIYLM